MDEQVVKIFENEEKIDNKTSNIRNFKNFQKRAIIYHNFIANNTVLKVTWGKHLNSHFMGNQLVFSGAILQATFGVAPVPNFIPLNDVFASDWCHAHSCVGWIHRDLLLSCNSVVSGGEREEKLWKFRRGKLGATLCGSTYFGILCNLRKIRRAKMGESQIWNLELLFFTVIYFYASRRVINPIGCSG